MGIRAVLADNLRQLRAENRLSQEDLADRAEIDRTYISSLERQRYGATIDVLERLAKALNVKPAELLERRARPSTRRKSPG